MKIILADFLGVEASSSLFRSNEIVLSWWRRTGKCDAANSIVVHGIFLDITSLILLAFLIPARFDVVLSRGSVGRAVVV